MASASDPFDSDAPFDDGVDGEARADRRTGRTPRREPKPPRPMTEDRLERAALHYLQRYASSAENLRRVLRRRVMKAAHANGTDPDAFDEEIDGIVARCVRAGYLDDDAYARGRALSLRRQGRSARMVRAKLGEKGLDRDVIDGALALADGDAAEPELDAAHAFARRRRLGPYRSSPDETRRDKDLAALARGGFAYDIARRVLDGDARERRDGPGD